MAVNAHNLLKQKGFTQDLGAPLAYPGFSLSASHLHEIVPGVVLHRCGGHFTGSAVLHWPEGAAGEGVLLTGDTIQVMPDYGWVSFMRSYPNLIPLPARSVAHIANVVRPLGYERLYGAWWNRVIETDAHEAVERSAARYIAAIA